MQFFISNDYFLAVAPFLLLGEQKFFPRRRCGAFADDAQGRMAIRPHRATLYQCNIHRYAIDSFPVQNEREISGDSTRTIHNNQRYSNNYQLHRHTVLPVYQQTSHLFRNCGI